MNVCWITRAGIAEREGRPFSGHAAVRMRALMPADELRRAGHATCIVQLPESGGDVAVALPKGCEAAVIDQLVPIGGESVNEAGARMLALIERLQRLEIRCIADMHDHHFDTPGQAPGISGGWCGSWMR